MTKSPSRSSLPAVFRIEGTAMHPSALLVAKLLWVMSWIEGLPAQFAVPFVPLWPALDRLLPWSPWVSQGLFLVWMIGGLLLLWNHWTRTCAALLGLTLLFTLVADPLHYHNHVFIMACAWLLAAASPVGQETTWFRWQFALIYLFAAVNKLWEPDWRSGQFFDAWFAQGPSWYRFWSAQLPPRALGQILAWGTIAIELTIGALFLRHRTLRAGVLLVATFHWLMFLAAPGITFGYFLHHVMIILLVFVERPPGTWDLRVPWPSPARCRTALRWLDWDRKFRVDSAPNPLRLRLSPTINYTGRHALLAIGFRLPAMAIFFLIAATTVQRWLPIKAGILLLFLTATALILACLRAPFRATQDSD